MKVGIFGGTFDPFTKAHQAIVRRVLESGLVDRVAVVPSVVDYYRDKSDRWLSGEDRVQVIDRMLAREIADGKAAVELNELVKINVLCMSTQRESFAASRRFIHTLMDLLEGEYKDNELYLIVGTDQYEKFRTWFCWEEILKHVKLIVVDGRGGKFVTDTTVPVHAFVSISPELANVSATAVRRAYKGRPDGLARYVEEVSGKPGKVLLHTPIFDVMEGPEVKPGFRPVQIKAPDWVTVIAESGGKFLMVTQVRYGNMLRMREFVCGKVEPGEDPRDAAVRELREETGFHVTDAGSLRLIGTVNPNPASYDNRMWFYHVDLGSAAFLQKSQDLDEHEEISVSWVGKYEAFVPCRIQPSEDKDHDVPAMYMCAAYLYANYANRKAEGK